MRRRLAFAVLALGAVPGVGAEQVLSVAEYRLELEALRGTLEAGDRDGARSRGEALLGARVAFGGEQLPPDASVLGPIARLGEGRPLAPLRRQVDALLSALESEPDAQAPPSPDAARLERLRAQEAPSPLPEGGEVGLGPIPRTLTIPERLGRALDDLIDLAADFWERLLRFLKRLWPKPRASEGGPDVRALTAGLVALAAAVLALLAWRALRRGGEPSELLGAGDGPAASSRDEDPLSREAAEWERYARELEASGRRREAIRAWYHAVLVTLFRAGLLHYQKGRTNWEYAAELGPEAAWRPSFLEITRRFDREWYGRAASTAEALREYAREARRVLQALGRAEAKA